MRPLGNKPSDTEKDFDEFVDFPGLFNVDHVTGQLLLAVDCKPVAFTGSYSQSI